MDELEIFTDQLDNSIPEDMLVVLREQMDKCASLIDIINIQERARVLTIKDKISSTHHWTQATSIDTNGYRVECFWCDVCNMRCSVFEHICCLSIISRVKDKLPTYTIHNQYLMRSCNEIKNLEKPGCERQCIDCGVPEKGKTSACSIAEISE